MTILEANINCFFILAGHGLYRDYIHNPMKLVLLFCLLGKN